MSLTTATPNAVAEATNARPAIQSHLSDPKYGFDFVVATTQGSINATMAQFLRRYRGQEIVACYVWRQDSEGTDAIDPAVLAARTGVDPFSVPADADPRSPAVQALYDADFAYAFRARLGAPEDLPRVPDVVTMDRGSSSFVTYRLFFAEFELLSLTTQGRRVLWKHLTQSPDAPWTFGFTVNLSTRRGPASTFSELPQAVQERVDDVGADAFSVQQLYLDLNTPGLQDSPRIEGLEPDSDAAQGLQRYFLGKYWQNLKDSGSSEVALGYTLQPTRPDPVAPSIQPTDIEMAVSPHTDGTGQPTGDYDLYSLDYLVMAENKQMPSFGSFSWNWVVDPQDPPDGVIAVNREAFAGFVSKLLSEPLRECCWQPRVRLTSEDVVYVVSRLWRDDPTSFPVFVPAHDPSNPAKVLSFAYVSDMTEDTATIFGYSMAMQAFTTSDIEFRDNTITVRTTFRLYANAQGFLEDDKDGDIVNFRVEASYVLGVVGPALKVVRGEAPKRVDLQTGEASRNFLENMLDSSVSGAVIEQARSYYAGVERHLDRFGDRVVEILNGPGWVFPGGNTFAFKDVRFSPYQDLLSTLTYREVLPPDPAADLAADTAVTSR